MPATDIVHAADPNSQEALDALRHSCAHVMAQAVQSSTWISSSPEATSEVSPQWGQPLRYCVSMA